MVDIKAHSLADGALSERRMPTGPSAPALGAAAAADRNSALTERSVASVQTAISVKAQIMQAFSGLRASLETLAKAGQSPSGTAAAAPSQTALSAGDGARPQGTAQIIVARFAPHVRADTLLQPPTGPVKLSTALSDHLLTMGPGKQTLTSVVQSLNSIPGLKAWLLPTQQGLALVVKSLPGTANALQPASLRTLWGLLQALSPQDQPLVVAMDDIPATDRSPATLQTQLPGKETVAALQVKVAALIREMNAIITFLASFAKRGASNGTPISAQDRIFAQALLDRLRKIATRPVYGFASDPVLPADVGVDLGADGLLVFNKACFNSFASHRQDLLAAMIGPDGGRDDRVPSLTPADLLDKGVYRLIYDPTQRPVIATLGGAALPFCHDPQGRPVLTLGAPDQALGIVLAKDAPMATDLVYRLSLFDQLAGIAGAAQDGSRASAPSDHAASENLILAVLAQAADASDITAPPVQDTLPPQLAELLFYLLWIGLFVPRVDRDRRKRPHRSRGPMPDGASLPMFWQPLPQPQPDDP